MEDTQALLALVGTFLGGGFLGTLLGKFWDNHREDRYRFAAVQRDLAVKFLDLFFTVSLAAIDRARETHRLRMAKRAADDEEDYGLHLEVNDAKVQVSRTSKAYWEAMEEWTYLYQHGELIFDKRTNTIAKEMLGLTWEFARSLEVDEDWEARSDQWGKETMDLRIAFVSAVRRSLGVRR